MLSPGEIIRKVRQSKGLDRESFGALFGVSGRSIENYENDRQKVPDEFALKFEIDYGVPFKFLRTGKGEAHFERNIIDENEVVEQLKLTGKRIANYASVNGFSPEQMSKKLHMTLREYEEWIATEEPITEKQLLSVIKYLNNGIELNWFLYGTVSPVAVPAQNEHTEISETLSDTDSTLTSDEVREIKNILKIFKSESANLLKDKVFLLPDND